MNKYWTEQVAFRRAPVATAAGAAAAAADGGGAPLEGAAESAALAPKQSDGGGGGGGGGEAAVVVGGRVSGVAQKHSFVVGSLDDGDELSYTFHAQRQRWWGGVD
eukprot:SAG25_NODE_2155_length_1889_cov_1.712291_2_plen_105_part_00